MWVLILDQIGNVNPGLGYDHHVRITVMTPAVREKITQGLRAISPPKCKKEPSKKKKKNLEKKKEPLKKKSSWKSP